ncbi:MAG TPA: ABC transporter permease [Gammaproteobacteria bacterium]|nr:ABC transporter permease [Gammaproteobacteria bacterium]
MNLLDYAPDFLHGLMVTIGLMACALALGLVLALLMTLAAISKYPLLRAPVNAFVFFMRGTPLLVQIFLIYYGSGQFDWLKASPLWILLREPFACAVIAFALNTSAYTTVLLKGAIASVPENEVAAAAALGMSRGLMLRRIIFPRAMRMALPAYSNEVIMMLKGTSLASTITLLDLMGVTNQIIAKTYATMEFLCIAGILYLCLNVIIVGLFKMLERRANVYLQPN